MPLPVGLPVGLFASWIVCQLGCLPLSCMQWVCVQPSPIRLAISANGRG
ncbi:MAG: hypothetical protein MUF49_20465 [Oculatellaceae cyanobacterium Prado106]|nr:hypothetical protein [Oculatellaceae cyanobacterium Prado106]